VGRKGKKRNFGHFFADRQDIFRSNFATKRKVSSEAEVIAASANIM